MSHDGVRTRSVTPSAHRPAHRPAIRPASRAALRSAAFLTAGALAVSALAGCGSGDDDEHHRDHAAAQDIAPAARARLAYGGTVRWAIDTMPQTLNAFQADADAATSRIASTVLPSLFRLDSRGQPLRDPDYLLSARVIAQRPRQVVRYRLRRQAVWSDGRAISAADFAAQWHALSGRNAAYWTARNAGYDRIEKVERGATAHEVRVTFARPYADWRSLFTPLYPKDVMGTPDTFNDSARRKLKVTAGPFTLARFDGDHDQITVRRSSRWWGRRARLSAIVFRAVPRNKRAAALAAGTLDVAEVDTADARRIARAGRDRSGKGPLGHRAAPAPAPAAGSAAALHGSGAGGAAGDGDARRRTREAVEAYAAEQAGLRRIVVRKSLEPAYTQLALNGAGGPLSDDRVRRAVARAIDRAALARLVLGPLGLPARPVGSHLALAGQAGYADGSGALGKQDTEEAEALLADAGWVRGGAAGRRKEADQARRGDGAAPDGHDRQGVPGPHGAHGAQGSAAPVGAGARGRADTAAGPLAKNGKPLLLRFVLPSGPGSESLRTVGDRIARMLRHIGIRTQTTRVADDSYFNDHIASGQYDLALYSWPASAFPATDARPIFAKPVPGADGSLNVEQNYTRVGTDHIDQLFDQAMTELDPVKEAALVKKADQRIWAEAGSIPLYQRPQLVAVRSHLVNVGAFGFEDPRYQDIGFAKRAPKRAHGAHGPQAAHGAHAAHAWNGANRSNEEKRD